jgi:lipoate-protein ligase A
VHWRLLMDGPHSASWNMAMDAAMLDAAGMGLAPATVRIYTWDEAAVTVGLHQDVGAGIDAAWCASEGIPVVRRPTGGRGILHGTDLTVSIAARIEALPSDCRSVIESYRYLSAGFVDALGSLGLDGGMGECERRELGGGDCFAARSRADVVTVAGRKLIGSAQRRQGGALLQQSSIRYRRPAVAVADVFRGPVEEGSYPLENVPVEQLTRSLARSFAGLFGTEPEKTVGPSGWEEERCATLIRTFAPLSPGSNG